MIKMYQIESALTDMVAKLKFNAKFFSDLIEMGGTYSGH
jgi:hypothetical protein